MQQHAHALTLDSCITAPSYTPCSFLPGLLDPLLTRIQRPLALCLLGHFLVRLGVYVSSRQLVRNTARWVPHIVESPS